MECLTKLAFFDMSGQIHAELESKLIFFIFSSFSL
jgi:hypothetical protein